MKKKLLIAGAALLLAAQTGITAFASGRNVFPVGSGQAGLVWHHHAGLASTVTGQTSVYCMTVSETAALDMETAAGITVDPDITEWVISDNRCGKRGCRERSDFPAAFFRILVLETEGGE